MDYDLVVVGGGAAGIAAARSAAGAGHRVVMLVDGPVGGDCTFTGCVPSKTLIEAAAAGMSFESAMERVHQTIAKIAATESADVLRSEGIDVIEGRAAFVDATHLETVGPPRWGSCSVTGDFWTVSFTFRAHGGRPSSAGPGGART